jgi:hypothetical protein
MSEEATMMVDWTMLSTFLTALVDWAAAVVVLLVVGRPTRDARGCGQWLAARQRVHGNPATLVTPARSRAGSSLMREASKAPVTEMTEAPMETRP